MEVELNGKIKTFYFFEDIFWWLIENFVTLNYYARQSVKGNFLVFKWKIFFL